ncbi:DUF3099 domain-containing protein [Corynebacterium sp. 13CS0277]|uniref:DUF3099 domain-containing protein n=1 Tax=Corynebacterium sp. 13CS0277 TaxID=2071994 RepID=UPI001E4AA500|nr:DUF3099 domain-containing protein [Corynebacterium sp. 13CS0277]
MAVFRKRRRVELITDARQSPLENHEHRKKVYNILQGLRVPFLVAAAWAYLGWHNVWLSGILMLICVPLPWVAVVIGNGIGEPHDARVKQVYKPQVQRDAARVAALEQQSAAALPAAGVGGAGVVDMVRPASPTGAVRPPSASTWSGVVIDHDEVDTDDAAAASTAPHAADAEPEAAAESAPGDSRQAHVADDSGSTSAIPQPRRRGLLT